MSDQGLLEAFNDCLDRINAGQSINDCLRLYPQYAAALRPMLEVGRLVERAQVSPFEVQTAQARVRTRMNERLQTAPQSRPAYLRFALLAASFLITLAAVFGMAESSLPGDSLYGLKRITEDARTLITGDEFATRRLDEIRVLLALRRPATVNFSGSVEQIDGEQWLVAGQPVSVPDGTPGANGLVVGDRVRVDAETTVQGELVADEVTLLEAGNVPPPTLPPTMTQVFTATFSATPTPTPSTTPTVSSTATITPTATQSATMTATWTPSVCLPTQPAGWISYIIQSNDTVVGLASVTGTTVEQLVAVNCLPPTLMIVVGRLLFLPVLPPAPSAPVEQASTSAPPSAGDDHGGSSNSGSGSSDDDDDDDNSGPGGGDDDDGGDD